jgi:hypothetical protein
MFVPGTSRMGIDRLLENAGMHTSWGIRKIKDLGRPDLDRPGHRHTAWRWLLHAGA